MNEQELKEYTDYLLSQGFTPELAKEYLQEHGMIGPEKSFGMKALEGAGRVLDYAGGLTRTGVANIADQFTDKELVQDGDWKRAFRGEAPTSAEILERAEIPEGAKVDLMPEIPIPFTDMRIGEGDSSMRDVGGFVLDTALDPLNYVTLGGTKAVKETLRPFSRVTNNASKNLYKSGLKKIDEKLIEKGNRPISPILWDEGKWGSNKKLLNDVENINDEKMLTRDEMYSQGDKAGVRADPSQATQYARPEIERLKRDPTLKEITDQLEAKLASYESGGPVSLGQMSEWKTNLYDSLPANAYDQYGKLKRPVQRFQRDLARGFKETIEGGAELAGIGGKNLSNLNSEIGTLIASKKPLYQEVKKANTKNPFTAIDGGLLGFAITNPTQGLPVLAIKKAADIGKTTAFRTGAGMLGKNLTEHNIMGPAYDIIARGLLTDTIRPEQQNMSVWESVKNGR